MKNRKIARWLEVAPAILLLAHTAYFTPAMAGSKQVASTTIDTAVIDTAMADWVTSRKLAGAVVGVMKDGKIVLIKGYGMADLEDDQPVKPDTIFRIGSLTKQFTSAMLLMLVERGQLSLSDPISKYFPDFPHPEGITVRHLLDHTSGIHSYTDKTFMGSRAWREHSTGEMISYIAGQERLNDFPVGTDYQYNNSAYVMAGAIVEKLTGKSYAVALQDMIAKPLGLSDTAYDNERTIVPRRAKGHYPLRNALEYPGAFSVSVSGGAGAMRSTAADLLRWSAALFGGKVLKPESLTLMIEPSKLKDGRATSQVQEPDAGGDPPLEYGLGIKSGSRDGRRLIGHGGEIPGFSSMLYTYPDERTTIVMLANTQGAVGERFSTVANAWFASQRIK